MAVACDAKSITATAESYASLSERDLLVVQTYLLAVIANGTAGTTTNPKQLVALAAAFYAIDGMIPEVQAYLLCATANAVGA
jgi:hypothetical protein